MRNLVIIGAGGFGRSTYHIAMQSLGFNVDYDIKGFLDDDLTALDDFTGYPPILDTLGSYSIRKGDVFICSIGNVSTKRKVIDSFIKKGASFVSVVHKSANIGHQATIGEGCIIGINTIIDANAAIDDFCLIQSGAVIGHDAIIGKYSRIDCNVICVGGVIIGEEVTVHSSAVINHNVRIGNQAKVGAGSFVIRNVRENTTVMGNPAILI